jgi:hypothetical protein
MKRRTLVHVFIAAVVLSSTTDRLRAQPLAETVVITLHAKAGAGPELEKVVAKHWEAVRRLNMVLAAPHLTMRGETQDHEVFIIEVLTWRDSSVPDHAPPEIQAIWAEMGRLVESRTQRPGLTIDEVAVIARDASR